MEKNMFIKIKKQKFASLLLAGCILSAITPSAQATGFFDFFNIFKRTPINTVNFTPTLGQAIPKTQSFNKWGTLGLSIGLFAAATTIIGGIYAYKNWGAISKSNGWKSISNGWKSVSKWFGFKKREDSKTENKPETLDNNDAKNKQLVLYKEKQDRKQINEKHKIPEFIKNQALNGHNLNFPSLLQYFSAQVPTTEPLLAIKWHRQTQKPSTVVIEGNLLKDQIIDTQKKQTQPTPVISESVPAPVPVNDGIERPIIKKNRK